MSEITSQSKLTTKEIVEQAISDYHATILPYLSKGNNGTNDTPLGAVQFFDDTVAPSGWLVADGTVYNIADYPFLANHYERVHGSKNYWGGDGTTTFAVPDWRGEFFRAAGPNAHPNQGSGGNVGEHQDGTEITYSAVDGVGQLIISSDGTTDNGPYKFDSKINSGSTRNYASRVSTSANSAPARYTSRPTCTSGLCCIKAVPAGHNYSTEEQVVGTWIDGKKLYQKTLTITLPIITTDKVAEDKLYTFQELGLSNINNIWIENAFSIDNIELNRTWSGAGDIIYFTQGTFTSSGFTCSTNRLSYSEKQYYITLQYTKTTD